MWSLKILSIVIIVFIVTTNSINLKDVDVSSFSKEIEAWIKLGQGSETFEQMVETLALPTDLQRIDWRNLPGERGTAMCTVCQSVVKIFISLRRQGASEDTLRRNAIKICTLLNIQSEKVCSGIITFNLPILLYIVDAKPNLTASTMCGVFLESTSCPLIDDEYDWTINIDQGPPKQIFIEEQTEMMKILQITDIHYDPNYEPYGNSNCAEPICCRNGQNTTNINNSIAGFWGDYNYCDTPWHAFVDALEHINATHQNITYVYFTGDIIDHGGWETSRLGNIESLNRSYNKIYETFKNIPVYPILGNHEPHPLNQFAPYNIDNDNLSTQWLYNMMSDLWIKFGWLPESTRSTIMQGGYYTLVPRKGFRIIALNNNVCYCYNWWLFYQPQDPDGQLQWLANTLLKAEQNGELVHILAHIPPGDGDCLSTWKREYSKIVNRFAHLIRAQFNGHTHNDELQIFYDINNITKLSNVAWNGGSVTTYTNLNPNYKVYSIDTNTYEVQNFENWMYNLTLANENSSHRPNWFKSYSFKEEYGLKDLSVASLNKWFLTIGHNETMLRRYYRHFFKNAEPALKVPCDMQCMKMYLCRMVVNIIDPKVYCDNILNM